MKGRHKVIVQNNRLHYEEDLMNKLSALAMYKAANALIGVSYTCVPCNIEGITFILTATGTAVYIEKE